MRAEVEPKEGRVRVRVWFGEHVIADHVAEPVPAQRYVAAMTRRFSGLRVTREHLSPTATMDLPELPPEQLWPLTAN
jgi:hypothetical protein